MPRSTTGGSGQAPLRKPPVAPRPDDRAGPRPAPVVPAAPRGKPAPALHAAGFFGPIEEFNQRVDAVMRTHRDVKGYSPSPGLVLDVARAEKVPTAAIQGLFFGSATAVSARKMLGAPGALDYKPEQKLLDGLTEAAKQGKAGYRTYIEQNHDELDALYDDPRWKNKVIRAMFSAAGHEDEAAGAMGLASPEGFLSAATGVAKFAGKAGGQIATGLTIGPAVAAIEEGRATYHDVGAVVHGNVPKHLVQANKKLAMAAWTGFNADLEHPGENPGYLFLDALGAGSVLASVFKRGARFAKSGAPSDLIRKPRPGKRELRKGGLVEHPIASENPLVETVQQFTDKRRNARMALSQDGKDPVPGGLLSVVRPLKAQAMLEKLTDPIRANFASENKMMREGRARTRIEHRRDMAVKTELDHAAGWSAAAAPVFGKIIERLPQKARHGLTVGEQKAIQILATDDPNPVGVHRTFHENMLAWGPGVAKKLFDVDIAPKEWDLAHRGQLAAVDLAEQAIAKPSKRLQQAFQLTREAIAEQERLKIEELGLSAETAEARVIGYGEVLRAGKRKNGPPPVPGEHVRLYRGEGAKAPIDPNEVGDLAAMDRGNWYADTKAVAEEYARRNNGQVYYIDIPAEQARAWARVRVDDSGRHWKEYRFPSKYGFGEAKRPLPPGEEMKRQVPESFYLPVVPLGKSKRVPKARGGRFSSRDAGYGYSPGQIPAELKHYFTGEAVLAGKFRIDATGLAGEVYARTVRAATIKSVHSGLWEAALPKPPSGIDGKFYRPIRDSKQIRQDLREVMEKIESGELTAKDAERLHVDDLNALNGILYPGRLVEGRWKLDKEIPGVKWVDSRLIDKNLERPPNASAVARGAQLVNEPFRVTTLFLRAAYILNAAGSTVMGLWHYGYAYPPNVLRALHAKDLYGEKAARAITDQVGGGHSQSYVAEGVTPRLSRRLAQFWNAVTDQKFREAALIAELRKLGARTKQDFESILFDPARSKDLVESVRRAKKNMVEFDNLTWFEQEHLRHWIFVYPWQSRALLWSLRTMMERPVKTAVLAEIGHGEDEEFPDVFKRVPHWFARTGYIPTGFDKDGNPKIVNPASVNTFSTLQNVLGTTEGLLTRGGEATSFESFGQMFGPAATFASHAVAGRDEFGNAYTDPDAIGAAKEVLLNLPQFVAWERSQRQDKPLRPVDLADRESLIKRMNSGLDRAVLSQGWLGGWGSLVSGGLTSRTGSPEALFARWYREQTPEARHKIDLGLIGQMQKRQAGLLQEGLPRAVTEAATLAADRSFAYQQEAKKLGHNPTKKEQGKIDLRLLVTARRLDIDTANALSRKLGKLTDPTEIDRFRGAVTDRYAGGKELKQWDADVRLVASFNKTVLESKMSILRAQGLTDMHSTPGSQDELYAAGRQALAFAREVRKRHQAIDESPDKSLARAELRAWQDEQDKPLKINGKRVAPSPVRLGWATQTERTRAEHIASVMSASWSGLSNFDKELVGKKVPPGVSRAWAEIERAKVQYSHDNPGSQIQRDQIEAAVKSANRDPAFRGILEDYVFSRKPKIQRLEVLRPYGQIPEKAKFVSQIAANAKAIISAKASGDYNDGELNDVWHNYVKDSLLPWLAEPAQRRLAGWVGQHGGPSFLNGLVSP